MPPAPEQPKTLRFRRRNRLSGSPAFARVFTQGVRKSAGGITLVCMPNAMTTANGLPEQRLGLSIGRRVGNAVRRGAIKRRLREAFRLHQFELPTATNHTWASPDHPGGYDWVVTCRPHEPLKTDEYAALLLTLAQRTQREWLKRADRPDTEP